MGFDGTHLVSLEGTDGWAPEQEVDFLKDKAFDVCTDFSIVKKPVRTRAKIDGDIKTVTVDRVHGRYCDFVVVL